MSAPGITFDLLDGSDAPAEELRALHAEVYAPAPGSGGAGSGGAGSGGAGSGGAGSVDDAEFADRFRVQRRQPGFVLAEARHGGYLVGYAYGMPLRPATSWWRDLTAPVPAEVSAEYPGRTFAVGGLLVRASWRRQGIGRALHDLLLAGRPEERATLTVPPAAIPAQNAFLKWGWRKVARTRLPALSDVLVIKLPLGP
ncbi:MAG: GNAT family N-acetyltransferase [Streptosporangiaceae bacterium]